MHSLLLFSVLKLLVLQSKLELDACGFCSCDVAIIKFNASNANAYLKLTFLMLEIHELPIVLIGITSFLVLVSMHWLFSAMFLYFVFVVFLALLCCVSPKLICFNSLSISEFLFQVKEIFHV